jgi:hypothetical protein
LSDDRDQLRRAFRSLFGARRTGAPDRGRLEALVAAARTRDYFEVLGVPRTCDGVAVWQAADALLGLLDRFEQGSGNAPLEGLGDARRVVLDAREVLGDDALRAEYLRALGDG